MSRAALSIPQAFGAAVARFAADPLVVLPEYSLSFADIDGQSNGIARGLAAAGIASGDRVALYCPNVPEFVSAYLGIVKAGAVVVPVNLLIQPGEIAFILGDAAVRGLIYHAALADKVAAVRAPLGDDLFGIVIGDQGLSPGDATFAELAVDPAPVAAPALDPCADLAAILYTSGTTGRPKGAMLTHDNLVSNTYSVVAGLHLRPREDRLLVVLPMFHSFAATVGMLTPALHGLALVPVPRFDPQLVSDGIARAGATVFLGVPSMYNLILRVDDTQAAQWAGIRFGVAGGAAMPVELLQRFEARFGFPVLEGDGPTECSPVTCVNPLDGERKPGSVGLPVPDVEIRILDAAGAELPVGEIGEIGVHGPNVMKGYWGLPDATAETFAGDWLRTGDLGYVDDDGYIFIVDRKKDMVIVNGMNVYPRMIEEVLYRYPAILEAAVVGEPHGSHGEIVVAYVVARDGESIDDRELRGFCREHLGQHQMPRRFEIRDSLPKNATGKILKRELRKTGEIERGIDSRSG
ncbi:MAG: long-chain fatty acid--CoA ligase [Gammaproteobacteria bacterium]|nr:long-chain fatty acid--CoA ligase [Gammaproteobacteria bacterium]